MLDCSLMSQVEQLLVIRLFSTWGGLKKSVMETCVLGLISLCVFCGKTRYLVNCPSRAGLGVGTGFFVVVAHTNMSSRFWGL